MMSTLPSFRELFDAWFFYLTNEGNSAGVTAKLTSIGTGAFAALVFFGAMWLARRCSR